MAKVDSFGLKTDSGADPTDSFTLIDPGLEHQCHHATFGIIVAGLQQSRGLAGIHR